MDRGSPIRNIKTSSDRVIGASIFVVTLVVFWFSPVHQVTDSAYSMLLSESLLRHQTFTLDYYALSAAEVQNHWQLERVNNHTYYYYPPGSSVLSLPFVAIMNASHLTAVNEDGSFRLGGEKAMQGILAPLLMAGLAAILFFTARLVLPSAWSVLIAVGAALGTQVWSTASRALWSHTWEIALLGVAIWMLLAAETGKHKLRPTALATVLAWTYFARPTGAVPIIGITLYLLLSRRALFLPYTLVGSFWAILFTIYSWVHFRHLLPRYYREQVSVTNPWLSLSGSLVSPSRGLLIYVPVVVFGFYLLVRYWKEIEFRRLAWLVSFVVLGHLMALSSIRIWWGGSCYGARLTTDLVPWFVLLCILGISGMLRWRARSETHRSILNWSMPLTAGLVLLAFSIFINARGALSRETADWENWRWQRPANEVDTSALWEWRYPQFLAGLVHPPLPNTFPPAETRIELGSRESSRHLWYGWSGPESPTRWTDGHGAAIIFSLTGTTDVLLGMRLAPFVAGQLEAQDLHIYLNEQPIGSLRLTGAEAREVSLTLPRHLLRGNNVLRFSLPNASSPHAVGIDEDERLLGVRVEWVEFRPVAKDIQ